MGVINRQLAVMKLAFKQMWVYKFDFAMFALSKPLVFLVYYFLWRAIYSGFGQELIRGFTFNQMISYYLLSLILQIVTWNLSDRNLARKVKRGELSRDLSKPFHFFWFRLAQVGGFRVLAILLEVPLLIVFGVLFFNFHPASWMHALLFIAAALLAYALSHAIVFLFGLSAFWIKEYRGVQELRMGLITVVSGAIIPLSFFPEIIQKVFSYLPFQYLIYTPILIFNGQLSTTEMIKAFAVPLIWIIVLITICLLIWKRALKHYTGVGV